MFSVVDTAFLFAVFSKGRSDFRTTFSFIPLAAASTIALSAILCRVFSIPRAFKQPDVVGVALSIVSAIDLALELGVNGSSTWLANLANFFFALYLAFISALRRFFSWTSLSNCLSFSNFFFSWNRLCLNRACSLQTAFFSSDAFARYSREYLALAVFFNLLGILVLKNKQNQPQVELRCIKNKWVFRYTYGLCRKKPSNYNTLV